MSDDKMRAEFEKWAAREEYNLIRYSWPDKKHSKGYGSEYADKQTTAAEHGYQAGYQAGLKAEREAIFIEWENGELLAAEVERLRAELAACQNLLDETRTELSICGAFHAVAKKEWQFEVEKVNRLEAELAAAKAAIAVPVKWKSAEQFFQSGADRGNQWGIELWFENKEQREQFHKWVKERGEG